MTPTLGTSPWLNAAVESIRRLTIPFVHVLVAPADKVAELSAAFPGSRVVAERGAGMYAAINSGVSSESKWDAFTYVNDDDILLPSFEALARRVERAAGLPLIAYGGVRLIDPEGRRLGAIPLCPVPALNRELYAQRLEPVYQHGTLVTRAALTALGGFDENLKYCGDSEFFARATVSGVPFVWGGWKPVAAFRLRAGQLTKNRAAMIAERALVDEKLKLKDRVVTSRHRWARCVFRVANAPIYAERVLRHGFLSFDEVLERAGR